MYNLYLRCLWTVCPWNLLRVDVFWMSTAKTDKASLRNSCTGLNILPGRAVKLQQFNQCDYAGQDRDMRKRDQHTHSRKSVHHQGKQEVGHRFGFFPRPDIAYLSRPNAKYLSGHRISGWFLRGEAPLWICYSFTDSLARWPYSLRTVKRQYIKYILICTVYCTIIFSNNNRTPLFTRNF